jgi:Bromodomain
MHHAFPMFMMPPDPTNPKFIEMISDPSNEFQNLVAIKNKFTEGLYQSTFKLVGDLRKMWSNYRSLFKDNQDKQVEINEI